MQKTICGRFAGKLFIVLLVVISIWPDNSVLFAASKYPEREIKLIIPYTVGGGNDAAARIIAPYMEKELGVPIVIDNQGGGAGLVGTTILSVAPKDGYSIGIFTSPSIPELAYLQNQTAWQPGDFEYLGSFNDEPQCIIVNGKSKWKTLNELIVSAKEKNKSINIGATGPISISAIVISRLEEATGAGFNFVQFDGTSETITALYGEHIDVAVRPGGRYAPEHNDGQLRILAVASDVRLKKLPDVPTIKEAIGIEIIAKSFRGWWVPAGIPSDRLELLRNVFEKVMQIPEVQKKITDGIADFSFTPYKALSKQMVDSVELWRKNLPKLKAWAVN